MQAVHGRPGADMGGLRVSLGWETMRTHGVGRRTGARIRAVLAALVAAAGVAGCSASVDPDAGPGQDPFAGGRLVGSAAQSGGQTGHGLVRVLAPRGAALPEAVVRAFSDATGFEVRQDTASEDGLADAAAGRVDAVVGVDGGDAVRVGLEGQRAYGRADVCVMADWQWFAANRIEQPRTFGDLAQDRYAGLLVVPDPASSPAGRAFVQASASALGRSSRAYWSALLGGGAAVVEAGQVDAHYTGHTPSAGHPLAVAPLTDAATTLNDTGTESATAPIGRTCLRRDLVAGAAVHASNAAGAASLVAFLRSAAGQRALARSGAAVPLDARFAAGTRIGSFAVPARDAVRVSSRVLASQTDGWLRAFAQARRGE